MLKALLLLPALSALLLAPWPAAGRQPVAADGGRSAVEITDDSGQTVRLEAPARRLLVLYAGFGETLAALGLSGSVVGRTASDDTLPASVPEVGTHMRPNLELAAALRPDLALLLEGREEAGLTARALEALHIPVARFRVASFAELFSCITRLGTLTGENARAAALLAELRGRLEAVRRKTAAFAHRPTVFFEIRYPNLLGAGGGSMPADIIRVAGGVPCLEERGRMVRLNEESLLILNPDIYLMQEGAMNKRPIPPAERPHFRELAAVRQGWSLTVPESRFSRPGPGSVAAVEELAAIITRWHASRQDTFPQSPAALRTPDVPAYGGGRRHER
jgi:iron complex transport system substrate-binding protein